MQGFLQAGMLQLGVLDLPTRGVTSRVSYKQRFLQAGFLQPGILTTWGLTSRSSYIGGVPTTRGLTTRDLTSRGSYN